MKHRCKPWHRTGNNMTCGQGYGTVRTLEEQAVDPGSHAPLRECTIADCGALPADADLAGMRTWVPEARPKP